MKSAYIWQEQKVLFSQDSDFVVLSVNKMHEISQAAASLPI